MNLIRMTSAVIGLCASAAVSSSVLAEDKDLERDLVASQKIFIEATKTQKQTIKVALQTDRPNATYKIGDKMKLSVSIDKNAYVYILNKGTSKATTWLFPNAFHKEPFIKAGKTQIPASSEQWTIDVRGPAGTDVLYIHAASSPLAEKEKNALLAQWRNGKQFADLNRSDDELLRDLAAVPADSKGAAYLLVTVAADKK
ncbi:DUF4384 domain-containing protein [Bradyrhizobium lablabi]|uniref:DUF4384 domain-containing protein n=1 Tax=Bradyrhizobium lablabi TaxID=722472 RepID=UPI001BADC917|nr:DUF4384 domain-containing protein [Bradyrhizobium lablabi]MBR0695617.1 DUF4384 domain-containing protein [Bradyrhizobium lablabi]